MDKNEIIKNIYHQPDGYGSMKDTYEKAKQKDKTIKLELMLKTGITKMSLEHHSYEVITRIFPHMLILNIKPMYSLLPALKTWNIR
jgi:hypothetical protein